MNTNDYPKPVWILVQSMLVLEGNKEVVDSKYDKSVGGTTDPAVAEKLGAVLKENESMLTMIRSDWDPMPKQILDTIEQQEPKSEDRVDQLLDMIDLSNQT